MTPTVTKPTLLIITLVTLLTLLPVKAADQKSTTSAQPHTSAAQAPPQTPAVAFGKLPKLWHSASSNKDFRVEVTKDLFRAEWANVPATAAKRGAYIRTECRRAGSKWVGSSTVNMLFAVPGAPAGKETKLCSVNVRFEVDSVSATRISGHSEVLRSFDVNSCRVQQSSWGEFIWVPKK